VPESPQRRAGGRCTASYHQARGKAASATPSTPTRWRTDLIEEGASNAGRSSSRVLPPLILATSTSAPRRPRRARPHQYGAPSGQGAGEQGLVGGLTANGRRRPSRTSACDVNPLRRTRWVWRQHLRRHITPTWNAIELSSPVCVRGSTRQWAIYTRGIRPPPSCVTTGLQYGLRHRGRERAGYPASDAEWLVACAVARVFQASAVRRRLRRGPSRAEPAPLGS
jgi:hypothetical protein